MLNDKQNSGGRKKIIFWINFSKCFKKIGFAKNTKMNYWY
ncbi:hypothetical protein BHF72_1013 [Cloacibacterium normanense]|uniref:Uncharacterized protein n=1 Tax=Cloacibacterium normanense TaxID=237258 RepID=A0A1E5UI32_9FLAO|nr:hypothetical protein BHF72_1013 [Cloacibacterium normanense]